MLGYSADTIGLAASVVLLVGYHLYLYVRLRRNPFYTIQGVNHSVRTAWVQHIMHDKSQAILAIQTLRNSTMAATFLASTAVLLMIGTLNLTDQAEKLSDVWDALSLSGPVSPRLWLTKVLLLVADFFVAFFCFAMSVRLFNHVGYQINLPAEARKDPQGPRFVAAQMRRAGHYYTVGMRAYFFAVPLVFWFFGPHLMLLATVILVAVLFLNDRPPRIAREGDEGG